MTRTITAIKIFLIIIVPALTIGFNFLENTSFYNWFFGFLGAEKAVNYKMTTQYDGTNHLQISDQSDEKEFQDLWKIIKINTSYDLPESKTPTFISRFAIDNGSYVDVPYGSTTKRIILVPDSVPVGVAYCPEGENNIANCEMKVVGNVENLKDWILNARNKVRFKVGAFTGISSALFGFLLFYLTDLRHLMTKSEKVVE